MPVRRYRDVGEMAAPPRAASALEGLAAACAASKLSRAFGTTRVAPRGLYRFRSVEEADAHRRRWEASSETPADNDTSSRR